MKKRISILFSLVMAMLSFTSIQTLAARVEVDLHAGYEDPESNQGGPQRGPVIVPEVSIDGYELEFVTPCIGFTFQLLDETGEEVYSTIITSCTLTLPSTLSGEYEILLYPDTGSIYFFGTITL